MSNNALRLEAYSLIEDHYRKNRGGLIKTFRKILRSHHLAEEVVQEAYTRALTYYNTFNKNSSFDKWFSMILTNSMKDKTAEERMHGQSLDDERDIELPHPGFNIVYLDQVRQFIEDQEGNVRNILTFYFFNQMTSKEISEIVPEKHDNVRKIIFDFRNRLRDRFGKRIYE